VGDFSEGIAKVKKKQADEPETTLLG